MRTALRTLPILGLLALFAVACGATGTALSEEDLSEDLGLLPDTSTWDQNGAKDQSLTDGSKDITPLDNQPDPDETTDLGLAELPVEDVTLSLCDGEGGPMCPCETGADCTYGWCVESAEGTVCAPLCLDECPAGWTCVATSGSPDPAFICVPLHAWLCRPCLASTECSTGMQADSFARCIPHGDSGAYCGGKCETNETCPAGYECKDVVTVEGADSRQCFPSSGQCACNERLAISQGTTWCKVSNEHGTCQGSWYCLTNAMSQCSAPAPKPEECNAVDDDCDGSTDEDWVGGECLVSTELGACPGVSVCNNGKVECQGALPAPEQCNGLDDDCDGVADNGFPDNDQDGIADCVDDDDDNDGVGDQFDCEPLNPLVPSCLNKVCGDDGCGGACGDCLAGFGCQNGQCVCLPKCDGKQCGPDGCGTGGTCGDCLAGYGCQGGQCICIPQCDGKSCGSDSCGGSCGECLPGYACQSGQCVCVPQCTGKVCGNDGCGGTCGDCLPGYGCQSGQCICIPQCSNKECGSDGCGGSCGTCSQGFVCQSGQCACSPNCAGKDCGNDGCGGSCGSCSAGYVCQGGLCVCAPNCAGKTCGGDGCGGTCGTCGPGSVCQNGQCICAPDCTGKDCGSDGCGGTCGTCAPGFQCQSGKCVCIPNCAGKVCGNDGCGGSCGTCQAGYTCSAAGECLPPNPCGDLSWNGECDGEELRYCHQPGDPSEPCANPPYCEVAELDCFLSCFLSGYFFGTCSCSMGVCDCLCI